MVIVLLAGTGCTKRSYYPDYGSDYYGSDYYGGSYYGSGTTVTYSGDPVPVTLEGFSYSQETTLTKDLRVLGGLPAGSGDSTVWEVSQYSGSGFNQWFGERVKVILGPDFDFVSNLPEPGDSKLLKIGKRMANELQGDNSDANGVNIGAALFSVGKIAGTTYTLSARDQKILVTSPRAGIIQIFSARFDTSYGIPSSAKDSMPNSWIRLSTLLHEARHSDGNGEKATYKHVYCDNGTSGKVCDDASNGPNAVSWQFMNYVLSLCKDCSYREKEGIRSELAMRKGRIRNDAKFQDPSPVKVTP